MPIHYEFDPRIRILRITAHGSVGDDEMLEFTRAVIEDPAIPRDCNKLVDLSDLDESTVTPPVIRQAAEMLSNAGLPMGSARVAMVAGRDFAYGLARMYQSYRSLAPERFRVFRERGEALKWLGVEGPAAS